jgi:hypothetical protein
MSVNGWLMSKGALYPDLVEHDGEILWDLNYPTEENVLFIEVLTLEQKKLIFFWVILQSTTLQR